MRLRIHESFRRVGETGVFLQKMVILELNCSQHKFLKYPDRSTKHQYFRQNFDILGTQKMIKMLITRPDEHHTEGLEFDIISGTMTFCFLTTRYLGFL